MELPRVLPHHLIQLVFGVLTAAAHFKVSASPTNINWEEFLKPGSPIPRPPLNKRTDVRGAENIAHNVTVSGIVLG